MGLGRRVARLEGRGVLGFPPAARAHAARLAAAHGLDAAEVLAGRRAVLDRAAGATSARGMAARIARADGRDPEAILGEAERAVAAWRAGSG